MSPLLAEGVGALNMIISSSLMDLSSWIMGDV